MTVQSGPGILPRANPMHLNTDGRGRVSRAKGAKTQAKFFRMHYAYYEENIRIFCKAMESERLSALLLRALAALRETLFLFI